MAFSNYHLPRRIIQTGAILAMMGAGLWTVSLAVEISASKPQGGSTNAQPNRAEGQPSLLKAPFKWLFGEGRSEAMKRVNAPPNFKVDLMIEPKSFTADTNAVLRARMVAINQGKEKYILEFPTAQHFDFAIWNATGKEVYRWSANKEFEEKVSSVLVNSKEKITYEEEIFSVSNLVADLPPGEYRVRGEITAKVPLRVETSFRVSP
jgi:hypothetical protein